MTPEEFDNARHKLEDDAIDEIKKIKARYKVTALSEEFEPGDSQEIINTRKECSECKNKFSENLIQLKDKFSKNYHNTINNYKTELDKQKQELDKLKNKEKKLKKIDLDDPFL